MEAKLPRYSNAGERTDGSGEMRVPIFYILCFDNLDAVQSFEILVFRDEEATLLRAQIGDVVDDAERKLQLSSLVPERTGFRHDLKMVLPLGT